MRTISAQEIKRRGISAVDELLKEGPVHVITRNEPRYVVMDEARYEELVESYHEAYVARVLAAEAEVAAGKYRSFTSADELMAAIDAVGTDDDAT